MELQRTGKKIKFLDVHIGNPFYAHNTIWIRTSYKGATVLGNSGTHQSACNFTIDECDEFVECIKICDSDEYRGG